MRLLSAVLTVAVIAAAQRPVIAQTAADSAAIRQTALDYIDGWYSGDAARMEHALHTHLAKRLVYTDSQGHSRLVDLTAAELIQSTRAAVGKIPREQWRDSVTVLGVFGNDAVVRIDATTWVDFLEEIKWDGSWKIVNVVWENRPHAAAAGSK
ncbi:MAG TPA: nuclear transport factor 2 family protein [Gemmatimonadaceae bacterium]